MEALPDHYEALDLNPKATADEIERAYRKKSVELRASKVEDAPEELEEVEAAYAVLRNASSRAAYDAKMQAEETKLDAKYADLDKVMARNRHHVRKTTKGSSGWLDAIWALFGFLR